MSSKSWKTFPISDFLMGGGTTIIGCGAERQTEGSGTLRTTSVYVPAVEGGGGQQMNEQT